MCAEVLRLLARTPFSVIVNKVGRRVEYKFYKTQDWDTPSRSPELYEVFGTSVIGHTKAAAFAEGLSLGYAQRKLIVRKKSL